MMGYYSDKAKTRETLEPDGWLHTGDLASIDEDGRVFIVDRKKDMILTGGYNVYPAEPAPFTATGKAMMSTMERTAVERIFADGWPAVDAI
jgi:acyl-CoA synthetase (AMP-forming)/AMP-acid ligase II